MPKGTRHPRSRQASGPSSSGKADEKKIKVEFTQSFDGQFSHLASEIQQKAHQAIETFIDCYVIKQFPKGLRVHKCGPFLSLSLAMQYRIFVLPISGGIKFVFVGNHEDADRYLRRN